MSTLGDEQEPEEVINDGLKNEREHLEREYIELCVEIERQQKELDNFKFKIKVANKEAEYYSRQIKEKEDILANLEKHQTNNVQNTQSSKKRNSKK
jgi:hypothetical protein